MSFRRTLLAAPCVVLAVACSDGTGPVGPIVGSLTLDFCSGEAPTFFAVQNQGRDWQRINPTAEDAFTFDVSERLGIAMVIDRGDEIVTDVYYATASELEPLSDLACTETFGGKSVNGSVVDVLAGELSVVSMGQSFEVIEPPPSTFTLTGIGNTPLDIVAHREIDTGGDLAPDRIIIRRAQNPTNGATLNAFDFSTASNESEAVAANVVTISGLNAGDENLLDVFFRTALGTNHSLYVAPLFSTNQQAIYGVPSTLTQSGDLHLLQLQTIDQFSGDERWAIRYYRNAANQSLALGPQLAAPTIGRTATSPYLRLRATLPSQIEYPSFATAYFVQGTNGERKVFVTVTADYEDGMPSTWELEIPDLSDAGGYPTSSAGLVTGNGTQWFVEAYNGDLADLIGASPAEGASLRWATRTSSVTLLRALRAAAPESESGARQHGRPLASERRILRR